MPLSTQRSRRRNRHLLGREGFDAVATSIIFRVEFQRKTRSLESPEPFTALEHFALSIKFMAGQISESIWNLKPKRRHAAILTGTGASDGGSRAGH
jgi:hypothetical protein